jgi:hypothetical protein
VVTEAVNRAGELLNKIRETGRQFAFKHNRETFPPTRGFIGQGKIMNNQSSMRCVKRIRAFYVFGESRRTSLLLFLALLIAMPAVSASSLSVSLATAQTSSRRNDLRKTQLGIQQKQIQQKMLELEAKFTAAAQQHRKEDPEYADRLIATYQQAKETSLTRKMAQVTELIDKEEFAGAKQEIDAIMEILAGLIRLISNEKEKTISKKDEIKMLEKFQQEIQKRLEVQKEQTRENEKITNREEELKRLEAQIQKLNGLIKDQKDTIKETKVNANAGLRKLDKLADKQFEIRKETENLKKEIGKPVAGEPSDPKDGEPSDPGESKPGDAKPGDAKPGDGQPSDSKPGDDKPNEDESGDKKPDDAKPGDKDPEEKEPGDKKSEDEKPGDSKPGDSKPGDSKPGESKPGDSKPGDSKPGDSKPGNSKPGDSKPGEQKAQQQPPQPGQQPLEKAAQMQERAEEKLGSGKTKDAERQQEMAVQEMEKALAELKKEKRRIASLPPEALKQLADNQRRNRDKTLEVLEEMKKAPKSKPDSENGEQGDQNQKPPGQDKMDEAGGAMKKAADDLDNNDGEEAKKDQKIAEKKMEEALEELEDRLSQLREETREEKLARLESRFKEMLDRQQVASVMTIELDDKKTNLGQLRRRDQLIILRLASEELEIKELSQQAYDLLLEDGTSSVFPEVVFDLQADLEHASEMLQKERTDQYTQLVQKEIETAIEDLIDALKEAQKKGGGGGGGGGGGKQPLLKKSAELKMLRMRQKRLNRRTKQIENMRGNETLVEDFSKEIDNAAEMQRKILEMTEGIMEKDDQ